MRVLLWLIGLVGCSDSSDQSEPDPRPLSAETGDTASVIGSSTPTTNTTAVGTTPTTWDAICDQVYNVAFYEIDDPCHADPTRTCGHCFIIRPDGTYHHYTDSGAGMNDPVHCDNGVFSTVLGPVATYDSKTQILTALDELFMVATVDQCPGFMFWSD